MYVKCVLGLCFWTSSKDMNQHEQVDVYVMTCYERQSFFFLSWCNKVSLSPLFFQSGNTTSHEALITRCRKICSFLPSFLASRACVCVHGGFRVIVIISRIDTALGAHVHQSEYVLPDCGGDTDTWSIMHDASVRWKSSNILFFYAIGCTLTDRRT